jgi:hypothetical protein
MSLRDFNEPSDPTALHTDPSGNSAGLGGFHTTNPEEREPNNTSKIVGALAVALMVGVAGVGLYAYSGSSQQAKPVVADNNLPQPAAAAPVAPPPAPAQQAANTPADTSTPAPVASTDNSAPAPAPVKEASVKPARHHASDSSASSAVDNSKTASNASDAAKVRMNADSTQSTQAPAQQAAVQAPAQQAAATPLPPAPQPSPSDIASANSQPNQGVQSAAPAPDAAAQNNTAQQQPAQQAPAQQAAPVEQSGTAPAPAQ